MTNRAQGRRGMDTVDSDGPEWLQQFDHTADVGIVVTADDLRQLFARAAWGMFSLITDMAAVRPAEKVDVSANGPDREALLVRWLSELNFRHATDRWLFCRFDMHSLDAENVSASVYGERLDPRCHVIRTEVKAITYHGLRIWREVQGLRGRVIFDV